MIVHPDANVGRKDSREIGFEQIGIGGFPHVDRWLPERTGGAAAPRLMNQASKGVVDALFKV